jgi:hypothetical protein
MHDHFVTFFESRCHLGLDRIPLSDPNLSLRRTSVAQREHRPPVGDAEERTRRHLQHTLPLGCDQAEFDVITVAQLARAVFSILKVEPHLTRCSSTPSAETFVNPAGSIRRTLARSVLSPPSR